MLDVFVVCGTLSACEDLLASLLLEGCGVLCMGPQARVRVCVSQVSYVQRLNSLSRKV